MIVQNAKSSVHIALLCECMCAHNHNVNNIFCLLLQKDLKFNVLWKSYLIWNHNVNSILCLVPQKDLKFKVWWKSDWIWLSCIIVHIAKSSVHIAHLCAYMCSQNHNVNIILCLVPQKDIEFQVWKNSRLVLADIYDCAHCKEFM